MLKIIFMLFFVTFFVQIKSQEDQISISGVIAVNQFTQNLQSLVCKKDENCAISGYSIFNALGLTLAGAKGKTYKQIKNALGLNNQKNTQINQIYQSLNNQIQSEFSDELELFLANRFYGAKNFMFQEIYLETLENFYDADAVNIDFFSDPENSRQEINFWVQNVTENFIQDLLPSGSIDTLTISVLINALYFKGSWQIEFDKENTQFEKFTTSVGNLIDVEMMKQFQQKYSVGEFFSPQNNSQYISFIKLPYKGYDASMYIVIPKRLFQNPQNNNNFSNLNILSLLENFDLNQIFNDFQGIERNVNLQLPKFTIEFSTKLSDPMKKLGMIDAFDEFKANFGKMVDLSILGQNIYISEGFHKAKIQVDEAGTEAAAATAVVMQTRSAFQNEVDFFVDVPFAFFIVKEPEKIVLFSGIINDPNQG